MVQGPDAVGRLAYRHLIDDLLLLQVHHGELARPAGGDEQRLAVGQHVHTVGAAGHREGVGDGKRLQVDAADGVGRAVADEQMAVVALGAEGVRARGRLDARHQLGRAVADVIGLDVGIARQGDQQRLLVGRQEHVGGRLAHRHRPLRRLRGQVDGDQLVAVLQGHVGRRALLVDHDVAGRLARRDALDQRQVEPLFQRLPRVDVDMVQAVGRGHEPLHVRRELQLVGIDDAGQGALHLARLGVHQRDRVARGVGHHERLLVGSEIQVVRLLAGGHAPQFLVGGRIDDADVGVQGIQDENRGRCRRCAKRHPYAEQGVADKMHGVQFLGPARENRARSRRSPL
ncbi:hypothetical protein D9M72_358550 [compost metagenome]